AKKPRITPPAAPESRRRTTSGCRSRAGANGSPNGIAGTGRHRSLGSLVGAPEEIRTPDPQIRRLLGVVVLTGLFCKMSQFVIAWWSMGYHLNCKMRSAQFRTCTLCPLSGGEHALLARSDASDAIVAAQPHIANHAKSRMRGRCSDSS